MWAEDLYRIKHRLYGAREWLEENIIPFMRHNAGKGQKSICFSVDDLYRVFPRKTIDLILEKEGFKVEIYLPKVKISWEY